MKRMNIRIAYFVAALSAMAAYAYLPLYENQQMYQNLALHYRQLLPGLNGQIVASRQRIFKWLETHMESVVYKEFVQSRMIEAFLNSVDAAIRAETSIEYAQRSIQLMARYEQKIKELTTTIEQLQGQEPLRLSSSASDISVSPILPEGIIIPEQKAAAAEIQGFENQEQPASDEVAQEESQEQDQDEQEEEPILTAKKLKEMPRQDAAVVRSKIEILKKELQEGLAAERAGTAQPGWREYIWQKYQQTKEWASSWFSGESASEEE